LAYVDLVTIKDTDDLHITAFRIPRMIHLPGVVIQVRLVDPDEIEGQSAQWDYDAATGEARIRIDQHMPLAVKRYLLYHELQHVLVDLIDIALEYHSDLIRNARMGKQQRRKRKASHP